MKRKLNLLSVTFFFALKCGSDWFNVWCIYTMQMIFMPKHVHIFPGWQLKRTKELQKLIHLFGMKRLQFMNYRKRVQAHTNGRGWSGKYKRKEGKHETRMARNVQQRNKNICSYPPLIFKVFFFVFLYQDSMASEALTFAYYNLSVCFFRYSI